VTSTPTDGVDEVIFTPDQTGDGGRLVYEDALDNVLMDIDMAEVESILDLLPAGQLTVNGTNGPEFPGELNLDTGDDDDIEVVLDNPGVASEFNIDGGAHVAGDSLVIKGLGGDDQFDLITPDKVVFGDATVNPVDIENLTVLEGRILDAKFTRTVDARRYEFLDLDGDMVSVFFAKEGFGDVTVFRDVTLSREADIRSIELNLTEERVGFLSVKVKKPRGGETDGETSIGHISGTGIGKVLAKTSDLVHGVDMGGVGTFQIDDIRDGAALNFNSAETGLKMKMTADKIGTDVEMVLNQVLANMKVTESVKDGLVEAKQIGKVLSVNDFGADLVTTRFQDFFNMGIAKILVKKGGLKSHIETDILGTVFVNGGDAELTVDILLDAVTLAAQSRFGLEAVQAIKVAGGSLVNSTFNLQPGTFMKSLQVTAKRGVGGDLVGPTTLNGDLMTGKFGKVDTPPFMLNGTLLKQLTATEACDADAIMTTGSDGIITILDIAEKAKIKCA